MAIAYSNDLRRKVLEAHERGEGSLSQLAQRFSVSLGWALKISSQHHRTGKMERPIGRQPGRVSKLTAEIQQEVKDWISKQVDLTLAELQLRIQEQHKVTVSLSRLWSLLKNLDLRLKKSRSTPVSKTLKPSIFSAENGGKTAKQSMRRT